MCVPVSALLSELNTGKSIPIPINDVLNTGQVSEKK